MGIIISDDEHREQVEGFLKYRHARQRQVDSVDPKQKGNKMVKIDAKVAEIRDRSMSNEDWVAEMMKLEA